MSESKIDEIRLSDLTPRYLSYAEAELNLAAQSIQKYRDCLRQVLKILGDRPVSSFSRQDVFDLKADMHARGLSSGRQISILAAWKSLLAFARDECGLGALDPKTISYPKRPRREVVYLTPDEVERFTQAIKTTSQDGTAILSGLRFRALVEVLLGSAMRIGEVLSLDREQVEMSLGEAHIVGKGNKQRVVFFTARALQWLEKYLSARGDNHPALFVTQDGEERLWRTDVWRPFARCRKLANISKPVRPHLLRHTAATQLLFNGCPVGHIKEILGHERLETTCRYYLGLDHRAAKDALHRYLVYQEPLPDRATTHEERSVPAPAAAPFCPLPSNSELSFGYPDVQPTPL